MAWKFTGPCSRPQQYFLAATEFEVFYGGAKGGGKSIAAVALHLQQKDHPEYRGLLLRETWDELKYLQQVCEKIYPDFGATWHGGKNQWTFPSGAFVEVGYYSGKGDINRYQGRGWTVIVFDELGNLSSEDDWELLIADVRTAEGDLVNMVRGTGNPGGKGHGWLKRRFITPTNGGQDICLTKSGTTIRFIPAKLSDNPYLMRDRRYVSQLENLTEVRREMLLHGNWDAAEGLALTELSRDRHLVSPFQRNAVGFYDIPPHWLQFGSFDWGFMHPWCFCWFAVGPDGRTYVVDTVHGMRMAPWEIAQRIKESVPIPSLKYIHAGRDTWDEMKARGERTPTIAEHFMAAGIYTDRANVSRKFGLNNMREYIKWRGLVDPAKAVGDPTEPYPRLLICKTAGNQKLFDCLEVMVIDPDDVEDVLKVDAEDGKGGDDPYDALRYGLASRPITPEDIKPKERYNPDRDPNDIDALMNGITEQTDGYRMSPLENGSFSQIPDGF